MSIITKEELHRFACYEISGNIFKNLKEKTFEQYQISVDDLEKMLLKLGRIKKAKIEQFWNEWLKYVLENESVYGSLGLLDEREGKWDADGGLIKTKENLIGFILRELEVSYNASDIGDTIEKTVDIDTLTKTIGCFRGNQKKPISK